MKTIFSDDCLAKFGKIFKMLTDSSSQIMSKVFYIICKELVARPLITTEYSTLANAEVKLYNAAIVLQLSRYVAESPRD